MPRSIKTTDEFWSYTDQQFNGCWIWTATRHHRGYGVLIWNNRQHRAHRIAYELANGPIPSGLSVLHHCDTPLCCNPGHLFLGTQADNMADMARKGRSQNGGPPRCSSVGEKNPAAKLTMDDVRTIRALYAEGLRIRQLAHQYHVSDRAVRFVVQRQTWKEVL